MKALEKDRNRRYESAGTLAADVERYLRDEPVQACPPSRWYRVRKLARRNKPAFVAGTALTAGVLLAVVALAVSNVRISREQARTDGERDRADRAQRLAEERAVERQDSLQRLKAANDLLDRARWYSEILRLDDAQRALTQAAELRPDHAAIFVELSNLHTSIGLWDAAAVDFARELELREPDSTARWYRHALLRLFLHDTNGYLDVRRRMHARFRGTTTESFLQELVRTSALGRDADPELERMVKLAEQLEPLHHADWYWMYVVGLIEYRAGRYEQAALRFRESLSAAGEWPSRVLNFPVLAMAQHRLGRASDARRSLSDASIALEHWTKALYQTREDRSWFHHLGAAAIWPCPWWDWLECRLFYEEAKLLIDGAVPPPDPRLRVLRARAFAGLRQQSRADAEYALALKDLSGDSQIQLEAHRNRGYLLTATQRWSEAAVEFARAAKLQPAEVQLGFFQVVAHAGAGDREAYRRDVRGPALAICRFEGSAGDLLCPSGLRSLRGRPGCELRQSVGRLTTAGRIGGACRIAGTVRTVCLRSGALPLRQVSTSTRYVRESW